MKRLLNAASIMVLLLCIVPTTFSQSSSEKNGSSDDSIRYMMPPVMVTATRVSEPWLEIPMAITTLQPGELKHARGFSTADALMGVPGVLAQSRAGSQDVRITIRGFGARGAGARSNAGTTRGIRLLVDGFPETEPDGRTSLDLIDFANAGRVDVLRSNASVVWGNAAGGVINVTSNTDFAAPYVQLTGLSAGYGYTGERLNMGTMLGDGRMFLAITNSSSDGWRYHSDSRQTLLNTGLVSAMGTNTTLGVYLTGTSNLFRIPGPLTQAQFDSLSVQADSGFIKRDERRYNRLGRLGVSLSHEFGERNGVSASVFAAPKYIERSERNRFRDFSRYHVGGNMLYHDRFTLLPGTQDILIVGIDEAYQDGAIHFYNLTPAGGRGTTLIANKREGAENTGIFGNEEIALAGGLTLSLGGRYDNIRYFYDDFITPSLNDTKSFTRFTPKIGATWQLSSSQSIYANIGGGVEVPAGNEVDPVPTFGTDTVRALNPLLEPITSTTYEIGTKHVMPFGGGTANLTYDVAVYYIDVRNDIIPYSGGAFYLTAGKTRRLGLEIGSRLQLDGGLSFGGTVTASRNRYQDYTVDSVHYGNPGKYADLKDNTMAGVPELFYQLDVRYAVGSLAGAFAQVRLHGMGDYFADDANRFTVPAYTTLDLMIGVDRLALGAGPLSVSIFAGLYNATDRKYAASAWINPDLSAGKPVYLEPGLPRNMAASVSLGWAF